MRQFSIKLFIVSGGVLLVLKGINTGRGDYGESNYRNGRAQPSMYGQDSYPVSDYRTQNSNKYNQKPWSAQQNMSRSLPPQPSSFYDNRRQSNSPQWSNNRSNSINSSKKHKNYMTRSSMTIEPTHVQIPSDMVPKKKMKIGIIATAIGVSVPLTSGMITLGCLYDKEKKEKKVALDEKKELTSKLFLSEEAVKESKGRLADNLKDVSNLTAETIQQETHIKELREVVENRPMNVHKHLKIIVNFITSLKGAVKDPNDITALTTALAEGTDNIDQMLPASNSPKVNTKIKNAYSDAYTAWHIS